MSGWKDPGQGAAGQGGAAGKGKPMAMLACLAVLLALHGYFLYAAMSLSTWNFLGRLVLAATHLALAAPGSAILAAVVPRVARGNGPATGRWGPATWSFLLVAITSGLIGYGLFKAVPNPESLTGINLGVVGVILMVPANLYAWTMARSLARFL